MNAKQSVRALTLATLLGLAAVSGTALADDQGPRWWEPQVKTMADQQGMISKKDFMAMMEKKFDEMDKARKGMLSQADIMRIFSDKSGQ